MEDLPFSLYNDAETTPAPHDSSRHNGTDAERAQAVNIGILECRMGEIWQNRLDSRVKVGR